ncbi:MAG: hypothetical protein IH822_04150 [Chloroflexi bacterium]|nr:hypothetical protein [Chloroflexota bacterium]
MPKARGYDILPRTFKVRLLMAAALLAGLPIFAGSLVLFALSFNFFDIFDFDIFDEVEVTVENRTERLLTIYVSGQSEAVAPPGETTIITTLKIQWRFGGARVQAVDFNGVVVFEDDLDLGDLERMGYRIVIEPITLEVVPEGDLSYEYPPCYGPDLDACLEGQTELGPYSSDTCEGEGRRLCFLPLGRVSPELILDLAAHYEDQYGIQVSVLAPSDIPTELVDPLRGQIDAETLIDYAASLRPEEYGDRDVVLIALTPVDLYNRTSSWRFLFGRKGTFADPDAIVSTYRMNPESFGEPRDDELTISRARKLVTKYVGLLYFDLPLSGDLKSPMFDNILSVSDLDRMEEPLPVPAGP